MPSIIINLSFKGYISEFSFYLLLAGAVFHEVLGLKEKLTRHRFVLYLMVFIVMCDNN